MWKLKPTLLFDEGSQCSFITRELADTLSLQPTRQEDICITSFGAKTPMSQRTEVALVNFKTKSGRSVSLIVLIVPDIAVPLRNTTNEGVRQPAYLKGIPLAHPVTPRENFRISLLIGTDHYVLKHC